MDFKNIVENIRAIARVDATKETKRAVEIIFENIDVYDGILQKNKLEPLFVKHLFEQTNINMDDNSIVQNYINKTSKLQKKYKEYLCFLSEFVDEISKEKIPYAILKGFSLANDMYYRNNIYYRDFSDIDVLVSLKDVKKIDAILLRMGFVQGDVVEREIKEITREEQIYWILNSHQTHEYIRFSDSDNYLERLRIYFDVNTTIFEGGKQKVPIETELLIKNTITKKIGKLDIDTLLPTYELIQLVYHLYKDTKYDCKVKSSDTITIRKICDIREYILNYKENIDWTLFISIIQQTFLYEQIIFVLSVVYSFYQDPQLSFLKNLNLAEFLNDNEMVRLLLLK